MAKSSTVDIIINGVDNFTSTIGGAVDGIGQKLAGIGKATTTAFGATAVAGLTAFGGAALGVVGAVGGIGLALGNMAKDAAPVEGLRTAFFELSEQAGTTGDAMLEAMQTGSGGTIAARDLMEQFNKASSLVNDQFALELPNAMELVSKAAAATGQDMSFLMDSLVTGVGRVSPMILDNLGVQVSLTEATEAYAEANGLVAEELTKTEQQMAVQELVMAKLEEKYGEMDSVYDTTASKMQQLQASFTDFKDELGAAFMPVLTQLMDTLMPILQDLIYPLTGAVSALVPLFSGLMTVLQPLIDVFGEFAQGMGEILDAFLNEDPERAIGAFSDAVGGLADSLADILPGIVEFGGELLISLVKGVSDSIPALMEAGTTVMNSLFETFIELLPQMLTVGLEIITNLIQGIAGALPTLIPAAVELISALVLAVIENIPLVLDAGVALLQGLIDGILTALPVLIENAPIIIQALVDAIGTAVPMLITAAADIINQLVSSIEAFLPKIVESAKSILMTLITAIVTDLPTLIPMVIEIIGTIYETVYTLLPQILEAGIEILIALIEGLTEALPDLAAMTPEIIITMIKVLTTLLPTMIQAGVDILIALIDGIIKTIPLVIATIPDIITGMVAAFTAAWPDMQTAGIDLITGLWEGIKETWIKLQGWFEDLVDLLPAWVKNKLGIGSPSKVFADLGKHLPEGLAVGIEAKMDLPKKALDELMRVSLPNFRGSQLAAAMAGPGNVYNYNLTMPTSNQPEDVAMAFELLKAYGGNL
jgi:phage-related protein